MNGLQPLTNLLKSTGTSQEQAVTALAYISSTVVDARQQLSASGALQPLVQLLASSLHECQEQAVAVIAYICSTCPDARRQVSELDGVRGVMQLLASSTLQPAGRQQAAALLAALTARR